MAVYVRRCVKDGFVCAVAIWGLVMGVERGSRTVLEEENGSKVM